MKHRKPTVSMFCVSYARDFPWLKFLYASIAKHCTGFHEIVLAIPEKDLPLLGPHYEVLELGKHTSRDNPLITIVTFDEIMPDPHMDAMLARCEADLFCEGDLILNVDSDCVWITPTSPGLFINKNDWAVNLFSNFKEMDGKEWPSHWRACTEKALGEYVTAETMRRHPNIYHQDTYEYFRKHIKKVHGKTLAEYLRPLNRGEFSEFCALGYYAMKHDGGYEWICAESAECPINTLHQFWSFHGVNHPDVQAKLRELDLL